MDHIFYKGWCGYEFLCRNAANMTHQPFFSHKSVRRADNLQRATFHHRLCNLQIDKAGVIHQDQTRFLLAQSLHAFFFIMESHLLKLPFGKQSNQCRQCFAWSHRILMGFIWQCQHLLISHFLCLDFHYFPLQ